MVLPTRGTVSCSSAPSKKPRLQNVAAHVFVAVSAHDDVAGSIREVRLVEREPGLDVRMDPNDALATHDRLHEDVKHLEGIDNILAPEILPRRHDLLPCPNAVVIQIE